MVLWISGIIEAEVNSAFFATMRFVQENLNAISATVDAGNAVEKIRVVFIINRDPIPEYRRFAKKSKILDARIRIDYEEFLDSSEKHRVDMFINAIVSMIQKTVNFDSSEFNREALLIPIRAINYGG